MSLLTHLSDADGDKFIDTWVIRVKAINSQDIDYIFEQTGLPKQIFKSKDALFVWIQAESRSDVYKKIAEDCVVILKQRFKNDTH